MGLMVRCLIPDLPDLQSLAPWLARIDENLWYTNSGPLVREFERRLLNFIEGTDGASCVAVSSGMSALELGLTALGIGAGSRVLMPALTFPATTLAVERCGGTSVLADVCPDTWALTPAIARRVLEHEDCDLVMPVAAFGLPLPWGEWDEFVRETGIPVFADAAGALGNQRIGKRLHWAFSLHATKPMGIGEGGLFVSCSESATEQVRRLSNFGFDQKLVRIRGGTNAKLSEFAAAVGLAQLARWPELFARRIRLLQEYKSHLAHLDGVKTQDDSVLPPATLCVRLPVEAAPVAEGMAQAGIETRRWYLPPLYEHPAFAGASRIGVDGTRRLEVTESLATSLLGLPFHTRLSAHDVAYVVNTLARLLSVQEIRR